MSQPIFRLVETTPPAAEPVTLAAAKTFLRVDHAADDDLIEALITVARQTCESATGRSLITRGYSLYVDNWPCDSASLALPRPPLAAVAEILTYEDDDSSATFSVDDYYVDTSGAPGRIVLRRGATPPLAGRVANGIEIRYTAGYGADDEDVPALLRQGVLQLVAHLYEHRGDTPAEALRASGAAALLHPYKIVSLL